MIFVDPSYRAMTSLPSGGRISVPDSVSGSKPVSADTRIDTGVKIGYLSHFAGVSIAGKGSTARQIE